jgi:hypothetical protein
VAQAEVTRAVGGALAIEARWSPKGALDLERVYHLTARGWPKLGDRWKSAEKGARIPLGGAQSAKVGWSPKERRKRSRNTAWRCVDDQSWVVAGRARKNIKDVYC